MKYTYVLVIPYPAQGHVIPLIDAAQYFIRNGLKVTFMVGIPDGMEPWEDINDIGHLTQIVFQVMLSKLEELIKHINKTNDEKTACIIADYCMGWILKVAQKMSIRLATFYSDGVPLRDQMIQLSTHMPSLDPKKFLWACVRDSTTNKILFDNMALEGKVAAEAADYIICNSTIELEPGAFSLFLKISPIGPLLATNREIKQAGHFWNEDSTCLTWLDQQPELALGLKLTNKPFLWVVRPGTSGSTEYVYPSGYMERIGTLVKIVSWAPQQEVLNHPSMACFMSHCDWNSTMEGVSNDVSFLCWPCFFDQFLNTSYICDIWKTGLELNKDDTGIVTRRPIKSKVEQLLSNNFIRQNVVNLQEKTMASVRERNSSNKNLINFIDCVKKGKVVAPANEISQSSS
nr:UDP-glycosyltransferase 83A1-like [Tanacetum cinerariifolium]